MKVALAFPGCHHRGGVERIVFECARFLASREHQVTVFAQEWEVDDEQPVRYIQIPKRRKPLGLGVADFQRDCTEILRSHQFDVLNTHGTVCPFGGVLWTQSVHRAWLEKSAMMRAPWSKARLKQRLNPVHRVLLELEEKQFGERRYLHNIVTTPVVRDDLHRLYDVPLDDITIVPNGFNPLEFNPERRAARRGEKRAQLGLKENEIALLFVANELERKGLRTILSAMKQLKRRDLRLVTIGRADQNELQKIVAEYGLQEHLVACGSTDDVAGFHAAADLFVLPTQYEAFCLAILESLGSGLPVVTTRVPGAHDAIIEGENGAFIDDPQSGAQLAAALQPLLDRNVREWMSDRTPATVAQYQWPSVLQRYERVLLQHAQSSN